ncbi:glutathione peroxidase [Candidatus Oscillochloris fontis]|uniref:glutathione peroxidase n=1 Tax=Candidatus Oscillochloris fontis TaxID=2496868 RepID=UPI00101D3B65|nr:glutathione peroxidase [Candidatus Oscillochloris fontis]
MSFYDYSATLLDGSEQSMSVYRGKVVVVVNVASKCGFSPQYTGLEAIYQRHKDAGLVILGFPCNQFANQEPGSAEEIREFCSLNYGVTFPIFSKVDVNGPTTHPLYVYLKEQQPGFLGSHAIKWNFTKFLIDRNGVVQRRYSPTDLPEWVEQDALPLLKA